MDATDRRTPGGDPYTNTKADGYTDRAMGTHCLVNFKPRLLPSHPLQPRPNSPATSKTWVAVAHGDGTTQASSAGDTPLAG